MTDVPDPTGPVVRLRIAVAGRIAVLALAR
jgi:hypothetical protein